MAHVHELPDELRASAASTPRWSTASAGRSPTRASPRHRPSTTASTTPAWSKRSCVSCVGARGARARRRGGGAVAACRHGGTALATLDPERRRDECSQAGASRLARAGRAASHAALQPARPVSPPASLRATIRQQGDRLARRRRRATGRRSGLRRQRPGLGGPRGAGWASGPSMTSSLPLRLA